MKKQATLLLMVLFVTVSVHAQFEGGDGSKEDPYQVGTIQQLQIIQDHSDKHFILTGDIDASETADWNEGAGFQPISELNGSINGNGHVITGLTVNRPNFYGEVGFIGFLYGEVTDLGLKEVSITGADNVGGLAGWNTGTITNSYVIGNIEGTGNISFGVAQVGGLVGINSDEAIITNSYAIGEVKSFGDVGGLAGYNSAVIAKCYAIGKVEGTKEWTAVGGLVGYNDGPITNSYTIKNVIGTGSLTAIGGLVGDNRKPVSNSYAVGKVEGTNAEDYIGGLVGRSDEDGDIIDGYWNTETTGQAFSNGGGMGLTTTEMLQASSFSNWDFDSTWTIGEGSTYPYLRAIPQNPPPGAEATSILEDDGIPAGFALQQNFPNPFNPSTMINFNLPRASHIILEVFSVSGELITTIGDGIYSAGSHTVSWNGKNTSGTTVASGMYFYRLMAEGKIVDVKRMLLIK